MKSVTKLHESAILCNRSCKSPHLQNTYRLIKIYLSEEHCDAYSLLVTTVSKKDTYEEFLFDLTRKETIALSFLEKLHRNHVTACTLFDVAEDFLAEINEIE